MNFSFGTGTGQIELGQELSVDDSKEVFAAFGLAIHVANVLEFAMLNALFLDDVVPQLDRFKTPDSWADAYDTFFEKGYKLTFGDMVKTIATKGNLDKDSLETLQSCNQVRNHLAHRFMREQAEFFFTPEGRKGMIDSCENAVTLFEVARNDIENFCELKVCAVGDRPSKMGPADRSWNEKVGRGSGGSLTDNPHITPQRQPACRSGQVGG